MTTDPPLTPASPVHLELQGIGRSFGHIRALDDVSLAIHQGTVHALVGENGAGKSTLGRVIAGALPPDQGQLLLRGTPVVFPSPRSALEARIALVAQELALVPQLSAAENVFLGTEPRRASIIDRRALRDRYVALAERVGFGIPPDARVGSLPISQRQQVEILRALARDADLIVLDEPTASLSGADAERLHQIVRDLAASGRTVVLVSHFLARCWTSPTRSRSCVTVAWCAPRPRRRNPSRASSPRCWVVPGRTCGRSADHQPRTRPWSWN
ncbi:MAG: sugar ABC transporter ATP-binding protein [Chloroflexi bacterium]|nr:sugar ABC transporter ATP-binding protein [Chloroflexota bacterium]